MYTALESRKKILIAAFLFFAATLFVASLYVEQKQSDYITKTKLKISEQETTLTSIALLTSKDGADLVVEKIIKDCSPENRALFDEKLSNLPQLKGQELVEMEQLFNACGNFFAERKAVMVARLERELEVYTDLIEILNTVDKKADDLTYPVEGWTKLVAMELERSELSTKLVDVQGGIIRALRKNITISSDEMQAMLVDGQTTRESLLNLSTQIDTLRLEILDV